MKKLTILRPVSEKAYASFVERICHVIADKRKRATMLIALERYLAGDRETYALDLTPDCMFAFEMLRFDIDLAITRSAKARKRVRKGKTQASVAAPAAEKKHDDMSASAEQAVDTCEKIPAEPTGECEEGEKFVRPMTRRQRRQKERWMRPKMRWSKL